MITQYVLTMELQKEMPARLEWSYPLYAQLLAHTDSSYANELHQPDAVTPISQYIVPLEDGAFHWYVNLLGQRTEEMLCPVVESVKEYNVRRSFAKMKVRSMVKHSVPNVQALLDSAQNAGSVHHLEFCTTTAFKSRGRYLLLPSERLILQSLVKKWNGSIKECPIEDEDGHGLEHLYEGFHCTDFALKSSRFSLKQVRLSGFEGRMTLENKLRGFHHQLGNALMIFARYSGVGMKTALGLGGTRSLTKKEASHK